MSAVAAARAYLGVTESPRGSNCQPFSQRLGRPCEKWCGDFVTVAFLDAGTDLREVLTPYTASCQAILAAARRKGWLVPRNDARANDIALFQFDRDPAADHVEIVVSPPSGGLIRCIGGNTGSRGLQSNGGAVHEQNRPLSTVMAIVRIPDQTTPPPPQPPQEDDDMADFVTIKEPATAAGDVPAGAVVMYTASTWCHLTPDAWGFEERMARLRGQTLVPPVISRSDMRAIQASRIDVTALNAAAHR